MEDYKFLFKVVLVGNAGVGKYYKKSSYKDYKWCFSHVLQEKLVSYVDLHKDFFLRDKAPQLAWILW